MIGLLDLFLVINSLRSEFPDSGHIKTMDEFGIVTLWLSIEALSKPEFIKMMLATWWFLMRPDIGVYHFGKI